MDKITLLEQIVAQLKYMNSLKLLEIKSMKDDWSKEQMMVFQVLNDMVMGTMNEESKALLESLKNKEVK